MQHQVLVRGFCFRDMSHSFRDMTCVTSLSFGDMSPSVRDRTCVTVTRFRDMYHSVVSFRHVSFSEI